MFFGFKNYTKKIFFPVLMLGLFLTTQLFTQDSLAAKYRTDPQEMVKHLSTQIPALMEQALIPGMAIAVIHEGRIIWERAFGKKNNRTGEPVTVHTVFEAASLSKPVFAYGVMKLVQEGKLDLDKPLVQYITRKELIRVYPRAVTGDKRLNLITARIVLIHSSGFPNWFRAQPMSFLFTPGQKFSYSGEAFTLLARIVEKISGLTLVDFTKKHILDPLGMKSSSYVWLKDYEKQFSAAHNTMGGVTGRGKARVALPGATLYTTAGDYARFLVALLKGKGLTTDTLKEMLTPQITAHKGEGEKFFWGLGIGLNPSQRGQTVWHWGDNGAFKAYFEVLQKQKKGVVFFANSTNGQAISKDLVYLTTGITNPAIAKGYFSYPHYRSQTIQLNRIYVQKGIDAALDYLKNLPANKNGKGKITARALRNLATSLVRAKKNNDCRTFLASGVKYFPRSYSLYQLLGGLYLIEKNEAMGLDHLKKSLKLNPKQETGLNSLGYMLLQGKYYHAAIVVLKLNTKMYPSSANCYDSLAEAYMMSGNKKMAIQYYQKTLTAIPGDPRPDKEYLERLKSGAQTNLKKLIKK